MSEYWVVEYELWPLFDAEEDDLAKHIDKDMCESSTEIDAINDVLYYVRGEKSKYEVGHIVDVHGPFEHKSQARNEQYYE